MQCTAYKYRTYYTGQAKIDWAGQGWLGRTRLVRQDKIGWAGQDWLGRTRLITQFKTDF